MQTPYKEERKSFLEVVCLPFLWGAQNKDGGWGYRPQSSSSVEPTCWALLALESLSQSGQRDAAVGRGIEWLLRTQLADGSWPSHPSKPQGCWCTSLAVLALQSHVPESNAVGRGLRWLCQTQPAEGDLWWQVRYWLQRSHRVVNQDFSLRGWSWTPGTSSWVEPTSYALLALQRQPEILSARRAIRRRQLGEALLLDRMCPGGGWNCGNPLVYGVAGEPSVGPTVWALLALRNGPSRTQVAKSLNWLESVWGAIAGPASIALAHICLETLGRKTASLDPLLWNCYSRDQFLDDLLTVAWITVALIPERKWLRRAA